jgi:hypothetical protein
VLYSCKGKENNLGAIALILMDTVFTISCSCITPYMESFFVAEWSQFVEASVSCMSKSECYAAPLRIVGFLEFFFSFRQLRSQD